MRHTYLGCSILLGVFLLVFMLPSTAVAVHENQESQESEDLDALWEEVKHLKKEMEKQKKESETRIKALEEEVQHLQQRLSESTEQDDLDTLFDDSDLEDNEEGLDTLLRDLIGDEDKTDLTGMKPLSAPTGHIFQSMNPNISVIGDIIGHYTSEEGGDLDDEFLFREVELGFSAAVDPFARADFFIGLGQEKDGEWEAGLEEGYVTFLSVPWGLQPRLGRFKSTFGKANPVHTHALPWVEHPLVIQNYFGDEGLAGDGVGVHWLVPNPWNKYIEFSYEATKNDNAMFAGEESDDLLHVAHLKNFFDLSDASTLELGLSYATAPNNNGHGGSRTDVTGVDITFRWRPPRAGLYNSFLWQTEYMAANAEIPEGEVDSWGLYSALDFQFARRWTVGTRYDYSEMPYDSGLHENAYSGFLTFMQSEFLYWRLAYRHTERNYITLIEEKDADEIFLQVNFGLGPHRAHKY
jgi:hypothetical protein